MEHTLTQYLLCAQNYYHAMYHFPGGCGIMQRNHLGKLTFQRQSFIVSIQILTLAVQMPRPRARPMKSESQVVGPRQQYFLKLPRGFRWAVKVEDHCFIELYFQSPLTSITEDSAGQNLLAWKPAHVGEAPGCAQNDLFLEITQKSGG